MNTISSLLSVTGLYGVQGVVGSNPTVPTIYVNESSHLTVVGFFAFWHIKNKSNINQKRMMQDWADYVYRLGDAGKVVPIRAKA